MPDGTKFYIITEWDRSLTTVLLPEDYCGSAVPHFGCFWSKAFTQAMAFGTPCWIIES